MCKLTIRESTESHIVEMVNWFKDESSATQWAGGLFPWPIKAQDVAALFNSPNNFLYVALDKVAETESIVGHAGLRILSNAGSGTGSFGPVSIAPRYRGHGLCCQLVRKMLSICFDKHRLNRVELNVFDFNQSAIRCYERTGFRPEGVRREVCRVDGEHANLVHMAILAGEWRSDQRTPRW